MPIDRSAYGFHHLGTFFRFRSEMAKSLMKSLRISPKVHFSDSIGGRDSKGFLFLYELMREGLTVEHGLVAFGLRWARVATTGEPG